MLFKVFLAFLVAAAVGLDLNAIKRQKTTEPPPTTLAPISYTIVDPGPQAVKCDGACPTGWLYYSGSCYRKYSSSMTFSEAQNSCVGLGAKLASIQSQEENDVLRKAFDSNNVVTLKEQAWIGLKKQAGGWAWTDGSPVAFTEWAAEPTTKNCALFFVDSLTTYDYQRGLWKEFNCTQDAGSYICEKVAAA
ncbi:unnamed protein product [Caenorhabditis auriculariae]|uniref:C-type lectin domain-containing protein n=1 Tax=Caenorhabditis auriculariae TaxID=2777116 RepID=A0A8S1HJL6_9PELO|nr:unnamed protein product [Caenorhabditis auriculariae]